MIRRAQICAAEIDGADEFGCSTAQSTLGEVGERVLDGVIYLIEFSH